MRQLYEVIKNDGPADAMIWKIAAEDFLTNSQLIVSEAEDALFVKNGVIVQTFTGGKYSLKTSNYPFITDLRTKFSGGVSAFNCKVYYVNKIHRLEMFWGTDSPMQVRDAEYGFMVGVRARGSYSVQVSDSKKFFLKLVGNSVQGFSRNEIEQNFRSAFMMHIKNTVAKMMKEFKLTVLDLAAEYDTIAAKATTILQGVFDEYGLRLVNFYITDMSIPSDDPNYQKINEAHARKGSRNIEGINWQQEKSAEILGDLAKNQGAGTGASMGMGLGMGMGVGGAFGNSFGNLANQMFTPQPAQQQQQGTPAGAQPPTGGQGVVCPKCGASLSAGSRFCSACGAAIPTKTFCTKCGAEMAADAMFCSKCGQRRE